MYLSDGGGFNIGTIATLILGAALCFITILSLIKIFKKFEEPFWKALIPIYNYFVLTQMAEKSMVYFVLLFIPVVNIYALYVIFSSICEKIGEKKAMAIGIALAPYIFLPLIAFSNDNRAVRNDPREKNVVSNAEPQTDVVSEDNASYEHETVSQAQEPANNFYNAQPVNAQMGYNNPVPDSNAPVQNIFADSFNNNTFDMPQQYQNNIAQPMPDINAAMSQPVAPEPVVNNTVPQSPEIPVEATYEVPTPEPVVNNTVPQSPEVPVEATYEVPTPEPVVNNAVPQSPEVPVGPTYEVPAPEPVVDNAVPQSPEIVPEAPAADAVANPNGTEVPETNQ